MHKKIAETFTNTLTEKCAIIVSVGASNEFSMPFYYTYIYKRKAAVQSEQPLFCVKKFFKKTFFKVFSYTFFIIASAAAHRVASQAAAASGVSPMAVI